MAETTYMDRNGTNPIEIRTDGTGTIVLDQTTGNSLATIGAGAEHSAVVQQYMNGGYTVQADYNGNTDDDVGEQEEGGSGARNEGDVGSRDEGDDDGREEVDDAGREEGDGAGREEVDDAGREEGDGREEGGQ